MINCKLCFLLIALIFSFETSAQLDSISISKKRKITEVQLQLGSQFGPSNFGSLSDFRKLAPSSSLLQNDFNSYRECSGHWNWFPQMIAVDLGISLVDPSTNEFRENRKLRIGLGYSVDREVYRSYSLTGQSVADTLESPETGEVYYTFSQAGQGYSMRYFSEAVFIKLATLYNSTPKNRLSFHGGFGFSASASTVSETIISYREWIHTLDPLTGYPTSTHSIENSRETERFSNKRSFSLAAEVPLGLSFRLSKKSVFLKHINLMCEVKPGLSYTSIPELGGNAHFFVQYLTGLKVDW